HLPRARLGLRAVVEGRRVRADCRPAPLEGRLVGPQELRVQLAANAVVTWDDARNGLVGLDLRACLHLHRLTDGDRLRADLDRAGAHVGGVDRLADPWQREDPQAAEPTEEDR